MFSLVEREKSFITSGPGIQYSGSKKLSTVEVAHCAHNIKSMLNPLFIKSTL